MFDIRKTLDTPTVTIAATQRFPGPAWDELPDVALLEAWPPVEPLPGVDVLLEAVVAVGADELALSPISASLRTTASATTTSTSPPAASAESR